MKQSTITNMIKAVLKAGVIIGRVEITPDGTINIFSGEVEKGECDQELEEWIQRHACKS